MDPRQQQDAHELFQKMLDVMEQIAIHASGGKERLSTSSSETAFTNHVYGGYTCCSTRCLNCPHVSNVYARILCLFIPVDPDGADVEEGLGGLFKTELLVVDDKHRCPNCAAEAKATRQLGLDVAPNVLALCIKRHSVLLNGKLEQRVTFPAHLSLQK